MRDKVEYVEGRRFAGGGPRAGSAGHPRKRHELSRTENEGYGAVRAIDPATGDMKWEFKMSGDVTARRHSDDRVQRAVQRRWRGIFLRARCAQRHAVVEGAGGRVGPVRPDDLPAGGKQHVTVAAGSALFSFTLRQ